MLKIKWNSLLCVLALGFMGVAGVEHPLQISTTHYVEFFQGQLRRLGLQDNMEVRHDRWQGYHIVATQVPIESN
jgi:hypothetical protein